MFQRAEEVLGDIGEDDNNGIMHRSIGLSLYTEEEEEEEDDVIANNYLIRRLLPV